MKSISIALVLGPKHVRVQSSMSPVGWRKESKTNRSVQLKVSLSEVFLDIANICGTLMCPCTTSGIQSKKQTFFIQLQKKHRVLITRSNIVIFLLRNIFREKKGSSLKMISIWRLHACALINKNVSLFSGH